MEFYAGERKDLIVWQCPEETCDVILFRSNTEILKDCPSCGEDGLRVQDLRYTLNYNL